MQGEMVLVSDAPGGTCREVEFGADIIGMKLWECCNAAIHHNYIRLSLAAV